MVNLLSGASIRHYEVVNGYSRGSVDKALAEEVKRARDIVIALTGDESISLAEVEAMLY